MTEKEKIIEMLNILFSIADDEDEEE